jgi:transketolase C-terminal domain/subunit
VPGKDEIVREGTAGWIVSYGEMLYRALDAVERLKADGIDVGLVNKPTLNVIEEATLARIGAGPFVLVAESQNVKTGLGSRMGTWFLERGLAPRFATLGTWRDGDGGLWEQMTHQGIDSDSIRARAAALARRSRLPLLAQARARIHRPGRSSWACESNHGGGPRFHMVDAAGTIAPD